MNLNIKKIAFITLIILAITSCDKDKKDTSEIIKTVKYETVLGSNDKATQKFSGSLNPYLQSNLSFKVNGSIEKVYVKIGDKVKKGQLLAVLDKNPYRLQVEQAIAGYEQGKAAYLNSSLVITESKTGIAQAKTGITQAQSAIKQAEAMYNSAVSSQTLAKKEFERYKQLYLNDNIAQNIYDNAKLSVEQANSGVEQAKAGLALAKAVYEETLAKQDQTHSQYEQSKTGKSASNAVLKSTLTQVELAKLQLSYTELRAPEDGTIAMQMAQENENVSAGMPIFRLDVDEKLQAEIYVSENFINNIKLGDKAKVLITTLNQTFEGTITEIGNSSTGFGGTYIAKVGIDNPNANLKIGMGVEVKFITNDKSEIITLPLLSVNEDNSKEKFVYVIENIQDNQGIIVKKKIKIGNIINNRIEVISGLTKNEKIVTAGVNRIVEGQKVKLYEEGK